MLPIKNLWTEWNVIGASILIVDDDTDHAGLTRYHLLKAGAGAVAMCETSEDARQMFQSLRPELAIVDYHLPPTTGIEVIENLRDAQSYPEELSIVMQTASRSEAVRRDALSHLVTDFIQKDADPTEMLLRVGKAIRMHRFVMLSMTENHRLEEAVVDRTQRLARAHRETFDRLVLAASMRDEETAEHTGRVGNLSATLACALGFRRNDAEMLGRAATLHDLGKIGVPDSILRKPGKLTTEEYEEMKKHAALGGELLEGCSDPLLKLAGEIALSHHEWWNGNGYPRRLAGEEIPLSGRIVAVADAYDALTKDRPYREARSHEEALAIFADGRGSQWDPQVVDALAEIFPRH